MKRKITNSESDHFILKAIRTVDYPWNIALEGWWRAAKAEKRVTVSIETLKAGNQKSQRRAADKYRAIQKAAGEIIAANRQLRRATVNRLAEILHEQKPEWPIRTIYRALTHKK